MSEISTDSNAVINDLLEQIKQLIAANTVLRVNVATAVDRIETLEKELIKAAGEARQAAAPEMQQND